MQIRFLLGCGSVMPITSSYVSDISNCLIDLLSEEANILVKKEMDPLVAASNVYKLLMENGKVRVLKVVSKPGDVAKMHYHPDHVVYAVKGGKVALTSGGKTQEIELKADTVMFLDAQSHEMKNIGNATIELIVTELKK
jgi:quercetin dioxygenase-like cupin family protein